MDVLFKKSYLLTDFCSHWVFAVAVGLSPAVASGVTLSCGVWASHLVAPLLQSTSSMPMGFSSHSV